MLSVGPLGDDSEALRLEAMASRGSAGGSSGSARSIHAIRCFNAQVGDGMTRLCCFLFRMTRFAALLRCVGSLAVLTGLPAFMYVEPYAVGGRCCRRGVMKNMSKLGRKEGQTPPPFVVSPRFFSFRPQSLGWVIRSSYSIPDIQEQVTPAPQKKKKVHPT